ncbi:MAG: N-acetylmuramoyl-L-alanine amidase family protein [Peptostreptococcaceae bacterium]|nr:N-acetylmuramoyl-L-alanine amidase family protein [Peptostreptococcaceae bacterium]
MFSWKYTEKAKKSLKKGIVLPLTCFLISAWAVSPEEVFGAIRIEYGLYTVKGKQTKLAHADIRIDSVRLTAPKGDVPPIILQSRTFVPVRMVSEKLGAAVDWNPKTEEVTVEKEGKNIRLKIGSPTAIVNGEQKTLPDSVAPLIVGSRTMLPIRFLAEEFSMKIHYDAKTNSIDLTTSGERPLSEEEASAIIGQVDPGILPQDSPLLDSLQDGRSPDPTGPIDTIDPLGPSLPNPPLPPIGPLPPDSPALPEVPPLPPNPGDTGGQPQTPGGKELRYELSQSGLGQESFVIKGAGNLSYQDFFLSNPERLVIDIKGAVLASDLEQNKIYSGGNFITQMNSGIYSSEKKLRFSLALAKDVSRKEISVKKSGEDVLVEYRSSKPQNSNLKFEADRVRASLQLKLAEAHSVTDLIEDSENAVLRFTVPYEKAKLKDEARNLNNNLVKTIQVVKNGDTSEISLHLKQRVKWKMTDTGGAFVGIHLTKEQRSTPLIVIDPGHGAHDPGAVAKSTGMTEKALNLMIGKKVQSRLLEKGYEVIMTRETDVYPKNPDRAILANEKEADMFVSIHNNAAGKTSTNGLEVLYYPTEDNKQLADIFREEIVKAAGMYDRGLRKRPDLIVLNTTRVPAVLLELGYMTNAAELKKLSDDAYQERLAEGIVNGIVSYMEKY